MKYEKITMSDIRQDLKNIKNYYLNKKELEKEENNSIYFIAKINIYNELIKFASPTIYLLYKNLYIEGHTQESLADKMGYTREFINQLNAKLLTYFYKIMNTKDFVI